MPKQRGPKAPAPTRTVVVPDALVGDMRVAIGLLRTEQGRHYFAITLHAWKDVSRRCLARDWTGVPDQTIVAIAFGADPDINKAVMAFFSQHQPGDLLETELANAERHRELWHLTVLAYLARASKRPDLDLERLTEEMANVWTWLLCHNELPNRLRRHPVAASLLGLASATRWSPARQLPYKPFLDEARRRWVSTATRRTAIKREWAEQRLGIKDPKELEHDIAAIGWDRLAQEVARLSEQPFDQLYFDALQGKLNFHKAATEQAIVDEGRRRQRYKKRYVLTDDVESAVQRERHQIRFGEIVGPRSGAISSTPHLEAGLSDDPEEIAARIARVYRLPPAQARVVRWITTNPGNYTHPEIAQGANVSLSTVEGTIRRLAEDRSKFLTILFPH